jgi:hypothetical protein
MVLIAVGDRVAKSDFNVMVGILSRGHEMLPLPSPPCEGA